MVQTHTKREEARAERLRKLPQTERLRKSALIKKREGRVLSAAEKHAMKMTSEYGEIIRLWEVLRVSSDPAAKDAAAKSVGQRRAERYEHKYPTVDLLLKLIEPNFATYVKTPRVSRVIQSMIKYASLTQLERILVLISNPFVTHATDAYGHFVVTALIRHAPHSFLDKLLALIIPAVPSLVSHRFGIEVVNAAYSSRLCTSANRHILILAVLKDKIAVMKRWKGYPILEEVLQQEVTQRKRLLSRLFGLCDTLVSQKCAIGYPFVQRLVAAYLKQGVKDDVMELCDTLRPHLAALCATREGAPIVTTVFFLIEPKKSKEVLRALSENLGSLLVDKYAAPIVARLFDLVYDVQLLRKYVVNELEAHLAEVINSPFGHQIVLHLLTPHEERKQKFLLPNWFQHNLFSMENNGWNHHTWLTHEYEEETVEIRSKGAISTHLVVLPSIVRKFIEIASDPDKGLRINKHYVGLIAREVLVVNETEDAYRAALQLSEEEIKVLTRLAPSRDPSKRLREEDSGCMTGPTSNGSNVKAHKADTSSGLLKKLAISHVAQESHSAALHADKKAKVVAKGKKLGKGATKTTRRK
ncbi:pumilio/PUF RNA binding protein 8, putative [Trypanosoma cruzi]|uniref:Pumilio/PUF RNA binding protein 8, putative n=1 Tax=Trypanosoma cruzi (strain CL Brener) TaxID=353153 RepID=Q4E2L2_TRYCC|nr:pumilio/PUF RNA binding protein 8, putative [Trypanosoma cruzi]EAN98997.1 pumilio/PUF RNA binding protein 8, putative [Trypanosoma cruzi]|eukprot:XP_820848.1 pumilio/PUF RNA binding protein 8 [Trypanosoma cruzi strain CL Brener]